MKKEEEERRHGLAGSHDLFLMRRVLSLTQT
jgi:hypothetical protein